MNKHQLWIGLIALSIAGYVFAAAPPASQPAVSDDDSSPGTPTRFPFTWQRVASAQSPVTLPTIIDDPAMVAQYASCVLQVDTGPRPSNFMGGEIHADSGTAAGILSSTILQDSAAKTALNFDPMQRQSFVKVGAFPTSDQCVLLEIVLRKGDVRYAPDAADKMMYAMANDLRASMRQGIEAQTKAVGAELAAAEKELAAAKEKLDAIGDQLRNDRSRTISLGYDPNEMSNLRAQKRNYQQEMNRLRSSLKTIEAGTANLVDLDAAVKVEQQKLDDLKQAPKATDEQINAQNAKLADAQAALNAAQAAQSRLSPSDRAHQAAEVENYRGQIDELEQQLKPIDDQLAKIQDVSFMKMLDEIPQLQDDSQRLRSRLFEMEKRVESARNRMPVDMVTVTILGAPATQP